jgi:hypothetical protein
VVETRTKRKVGERGREMVDRLIKKIAEGELGEGGR